VNPWSRAEPGSEAMERELFARRARALETRRAPEVGSAGAVPSLASVLRAAKANEERRETDAARSAHGRTFVAMALAAACMMAAFTKLPSTPSTRARDAIAAEMDASAPRASLTLETASEETCTLDDEVLVSEERACLAPAPLFTAALAPALAIASSSNVTTCASSEPHDPDAVCR
jgi:hypothetical protein